MWSVIASWTEEANSEPCLDFPVPAPQVETGGSVRLVNIYFLVAGVVFENVRRKFLV